MLRSLSVHNFVVVKQLDVEFDSGFTVLTGETGAGKSILIDALALALGGRGDAGVVRAGAERADVSAQFDVSADSAVGRWLAANTLALDEGGCLMRRVIDTNGRSRSFINGRPCTVQQSREAGEFLIDIHGQHQHQSLLRPAVQRDLLDRYAGLQQESLEVAQCHRVWQEARTQCAAVEHDARALEAERERLDWQVRELEALAPAPGEWEETAAEHQRLAHAASLLEGAQFASDTLSENEQSALAQINAVVSRLRHLQDYDASLGDIVAILDPVQAQVQEAVYALRHYCERLELDPGRLRTVENRIDALHSAARKHRVQPEVLPALLDEWRERVAALNAGSDVETLRRREAEAHRRYLEGARRLSAGRAKAARRLARDVSGLMQRLALGGSRFEVVLDALDEGNAHGLERVEFLIAPHAGAASRPLGRVASGGELSRISLAIQTVTSAVAQVPTLIFDEVDAGIGGRVAEIVGRMLKALGRNHQVMCVTHLPQVAAAGDAQWQVVKHSGKDKVTSRVTPLDRDSRVEEIARMLGGVKITATTRRHAAEMLGTARMKDEG
ncbi:MAG TPA: DNA repair protein RecN [Burkholderiales bacterium]|nr:DNA repair protein RecN [Burkholderiales bacterium]